MGPAVCLLMTLSACATSERVIPGTRAPQLPPGLREPCPDPGAVPLPGRDARAVIAELRGGLRLCASRHGDLVAFYDGIRGAS